MLYTQYANVSPKKGDVGVEVEMEFTKDDIQMESLTGWTVHRDGSLRGTGIEFVSRTPVKLDKSDKHIDNLFDRIDRKIIRMDSPRTSVHVHVNITELTHIQIFNGLLFAWILEESLLDFCGPKRRGNRFCLSIRKAPEQIIELQKILDTRDLNIVVSKERFKYSNIAMHNISQIGTIEFRGLGGDDYDTDRIKKWIKICHQIIHSVKEYESPIHLVNSLFPDWTTFRKELLPEPLNTLPIDIPEAYSNIAMLYSIIYGTDWENLTKDLASTKKKEAVNMFNDFAVDELNAPAFQVRVMR